MIFFRGEQQLPSLIWKRTKINNEFFAENTGESVYTPNFTCFIDALLISCAVTSRAATTKDNSQRHGTDSHSIDKTVKPPPTTAGRGRRDRKTLSRSVSTSAGRSCNAVSSPARQAGIFTTVEKSDNPQIQKMKAIAGAGCSRFCSWKPHKMVGVFGLPHFCPTFAPPNRDIFIYLVGHIKSLFSMTYLTFLSCPTCPTNFFAVWRCRCAVLDVKKPRKPTDSFGLRGFAVGFQCVTPA